MTMMTMMMMTMMMMIKCNGSLIRRGCHWLAYLQGDGYHQLSPDAAAGLFADGFLLTCHGSPSAQGATNAGGQVGLGSSGKSCPVAVISQFCHAGSMPGFLKAPSGANPFKHVAQARHRSGT